MMTTTTLELKTRIHEQFATLEERYLAKNIRPRTLLVGLRKVVDQALECLNTLFPLPESVAVCAVGGYGRGELYPYSDIDLLFLLQAPPTDKEREQLGAYITALWDLGLDIGQSVRTIQDCMDQAKQDITVETALLETRFLFGQKALFDRFKATFKAQFDPARFLRAKLIEYQQRHSRHKQTVYELEPNCKESPGALRDIHLIHWMAKACGYPATWAALVEEGLMTQSEAKQMKRATRAFKELRIHLHLLAKKREDRLLFHWQPELARVYQFHATQSNRASELFMQRYYRAAKIVYVITHFMIQNFESKLSQHQDKIVRFLDDDFQVVGNELDVRDDDCFIRQPSLMLKIFLTLQQHPELEELSVRAQRLLWAGSRRIDNAFRSDPVNHQTFLQIFQQPSGIVHNTRRMASLNILPAYLPAFARIVGQVQHDLYHVYTVDQHTLMVIRNIRRFTLPEFAAQDPLAHQVIAQFERHWLLYLAGLFHDIAKGRGGDHSELGAIEVRQFAQQHDLDPQDVDLLAFLVANHLVMSHTAQKRDISDPLVIKEFCDVVKNTRYLDALYLLTIADMRGTSPAVWSPWKGKLLADLYRSSVTYLGGTALNHDDLLSARQQEAMRLVRLDSIADSDRDAFWQKMDEAYFLRHEPDDIAWHTRKLYRAMNTYDNQVLVFARPFDKQDALKIVLFAKDHPSLFKTVAGYFYKHQINIFDAQIHTTSHGFVVDSFLVDSPRFNQQVRSFIPIIEVGLKEAIEKAQQSDLPTAGSKRLLTSPDIRRSHTFPIKPRLTLNYDDASKLWRLQVTATDVPGMLYAISHLFVQHHINLHVARILTLGNRVEDVFMIDSPQFKQTQAQLTFEHDMIETLEALTPSDRS